MRKIISISLVLAAIACTTILISGCSNASGAKRVDSKAISSVVSWEGTHIMVLDSLKGVPKEQRMAYLLERWPSVYIDLRREAPKYYPEYFKNHKIDSVALSFGEGTITANDKDKKMHRVSVDGELFVLFYVENDPMSPRKFFVRCVNGAIESVDDDLKLTRIGSSTLSFTINKGEGVNNYCPYPQSIQVLKSFGFAVAEKRSGRPVQGITYDRALALEDSIAWVRVFAPKLQVGTKFDLLNQTCTLPNGKVLNAKE